MKTPEALLPLQALRHRLRWGLLATFILIVLGAAVRVTDSGMACPDWPLCYGRWLPFPVPEGAGYTAWQVALEWGHRLLAALIGFFMLWVAVTAFKTRRQQPFAWRWTLASLLLLLLQAKLGGVTVWLNNINWSVALHLGNALLFYGALALFLMRINRSAPVVPVITAPRAALPAGFLLVFAIWTTMILGAMVSSSHAGGLCGRLPDCLGAWWPGDPAQQLHMLHRFAAFTTIALIMGLWFFLRKTSGTWVKTSRKLVVMGIVQGLIGVAVLESFAVDIRLYQVLSVLHLAWGTLVFTVALVLVATFLWGPRNDAITGGRTH